MSAEKQLLRGAIVQLTSTEDASENLKQCLHWADVALKKAPCDVIVFPENALFFRITSKMSAPTIDDPYWEPLIKWSHTNKVDVIIGGTPVKEEDRIVNATVLIAPDRPPKIVYRKIHLFDVDVSGQKPVRESDHFSSGGELATLSIKGWKIGLSICYDLRFSELYKAYADQKVEVILVPAAFLVQTGQAHWETLLRARAIETQAYILAPAQGGQHQQGNHTRVTYGHSMVIGPWGEVLKELDDVCPGCINFTLSDENIQKVRAQIPMAGHRRL